MPDSRVYILDAGCSKDCGYPLSPEMKDDLERFGQSLDPATSPRLLKAVKDTVDLMVGTTDTVDILVQNCWRGLPAPWPSCAWSNGFALWAWSEEWLRRMIWQRLTTC